jgi:hypothetical protein
MSPPVQAPKAIVEVMSAATAIRFQRIHASGSFVSFGGRNQRARRPPGSGFSAPQMSG